MITVMQGIPNVKLKSRAKAENVVRISEESLRNSEPDGCLCKKVTEWPQKNTPDLKPGHSSTSTHNPQVFSSMRSRSKPAWKPTAKSRHRPANSMGTRLAS